MTNHEVEILLVEDSAADAELTLRALKSNNIGNHVHLVRDGEEALDYLFGPDRSSLLALTQVPKVILLDLKLPKVDGIEVLRAVKEDPRTRAIPVVILTSSKEQRDLVESYKLGVNSYIQKPVDFDQFRATVKDLGLYWLVVNQPPPRAAFQGS